MGLSNDDIAALLGKPPSGVEQQVHDTIQQWMNRAVELWPDRIEFPQHTTSFDLKGRVAGWASTNLGDGSTEMRLNVVALSDETMRDYIINQTIPHEVAHMVASKLHGRGVGHGFMWKNIMLKFGKPPTTTHNLPLPRARKTKRYEYVCACRTYWLGKNRHYKLQNNPRYYQPCLTCGLLIAWTGNEKVVT